MKHKCPNCGCNFAEAILSESQNNSKFQQELDRLHAFYQKQLSNNEESIKDAQDEAFAAYAEGDELRWQINERQKTIYGLHRIIDGYDRQIERLQRAVDVAANFMDFLRKNTGYSDEWPIEMKVASDTSREFAKMLSDFEKTVYKERSTPVREVESLLP